MSYQHSDEALLTYIGLMWCGAALGVVALVVAIGLVLVW